MEKVVRDKLKGGLEEGEMMKRKEEDWVGYQMQLAMVEEEKNRRIGSDVIYI